MDDDRDLPMSEVWALAEKVVFAETAPERARALATVFAVLRDALDEGMSAIAPW